MRMVLSLALALLVLSSARALAVTLQAVDTGWYNQTGFHNPGNPNYITGRSEGVEYRGFFVFNLPALGPIGGATLRMFNPSSPPLSNNGFESPDPFEGLAIYDVSTSIPTLTAGTGGAAA